MKSCPCAVLLQTTNFYTTMKKLFCAAFALLTFTSVAHAQEKIKGIVYEDLNNNGKKDKKEKGLPNVLVSNGNDVIPTDKNGTYELEVTNDSPIFVIKPSGYRFHLDNYNLPKFYYLHKPQGSPQSKYPGVQPSGKLPQSLDFALIPSKESSQFTAFAFGDPQAYTKEEVQYFITGVVNEIDKSKAVFGLTLGDLVGDDLSLHPDYKNAVKQIGLPWYNVMGNHDMNYDAKSDEFSDETYESNFGPNNFSFNYGKVHFIVLDNILYPDPRDGKSYWGGFREDQLKFVENDLKFVPKNHLVVLAFHIPLEDNNNEWFRTSDREKLFDLLKNYPNTLSLSAHTHIQQQIFYGSEKGWKQDKPHHEYNVGTTSGDWYSGEMNEQGIPTSTMRDGTPKGYALIHFNENQYTVDYKVAGKPDHYQINVFAPKVVLKTPKSRHHVYANVFMGTPKDKVQYSVNDGEWKDMKFADEDDPHYESTFYKWDMSEQIINGKRPSKSIKSTHLFVGKIPTNLEQGTYKVKVKATDIYGKEHYGETTYKIN